MKLELHDVMEVLNNRVVIVLQYTSVSNQHRVCLKLTQLVYLNKAGIFFIFKKVKNN